MRKGGRYTVTLTALSPVWRDRGPLNDHSVEATPAGIPRLREAAAQIVGAPWRRVMASPYFATMALVRADRGTGLFGLYRPVFVLDTAMRCDAARTTCTGSFTAPLDGDLSLFTNDAIPPIGPAALFYRRNLGSATLRVTALPDAPAP